MIYRNTERTASVATSLPIFARYSQFEKNLNQRRLSSFTACILESFVELLRLICRLLDIRSLSRRNLPCFCSRCRRCRRPAAGARQRCDGECFRAFTCRGARGHRLLPLDLECGIDFMVIAFRCRWRRRAAIVGSDSRMRRWLNDVPWTSADNGSVTVYARLLKHALLGLHAGGCCAASIMGLAVNRGLIAGSSGSISGCGQD